MEVEIPDEILNGTSLDITSRTRAIDNELKVLKNETVILQQEIKQMKEKLKENLEKIKLNKQLPYLVGHVVEVLYQAFFVPNPKFSNFRRIPDSLWL
jgi:26S proteasome regulatory subunit T5